MPSMAQGTCEHCKDPIVAFIMIHTNEPGLWYLDTKPKPRPATYSKPAQTEADLANYKPWNHQIRTVPCAASPDHRHHPGPDGKYVRVRLDKP